MKISRGILFAVLMGCALGAGAQQAYPNRPIALVVAFSAGGPTDSIDRILAARMSVAIGQTVVVENTTGAGGTIGVGRVARGAPDGYLIGIGHIGTHVVNGAIYQLTYDLQTDLEPVAMIATNPQILIGKNAIPAKNLKELIAWVRANQDKVSFGTGGARRGLDYDGLSERLAHALAHDPRQLIRRTASRERHHQSDRPRRIRLRLRLRGANPDDAAESGEQRFHP